MARSVYVTGIVRGDGRQVVEPGGVLVRVVDPRTSPLRERFAVDEVRRAAAIVRERRPDPAVDRPIQYDAAGDPAVAAAKMPGSPVAGRATVLVFPDLNTGDNTYEAAQRSAGTVAVGPVMRGLREPFNDPSRGALVPDIVTTVAITAIQAQEAAR